MENPLAADAWFAIAGLPIHPAIAGGAAVSLLLVAGAKLTIGQIPKTSRIAIAAEAIYAMIERELAGVFDRDPGPFLPLLATLFLFVLTANWSAALPGWRPPTEFLETPAALAVAVFGAVQYYGVREHGFVGYLKHFATPNFLFVPFHVAAEFTRTLSLAVRLFGNMMSHGLILAIVASVAGLIVPIPFLALGLLIGAVQAYIFTILAAVYIAAAVARPEGSKT
jgi:F-type H+-transporting ATPase subunit a